MLHVSLYGQLGILLRFTTDGLGREAATYAPAAGLTPPPDAPIVNNLSFTDWPRLRLGPFLCAAPGSGMLGTGARTLTPARGPSYRSSPAGASCILGWGEAATYAPARKWFGAEQIHPWQGEGAR